MTTRVDELSPSHGAALALLWRAATDTRRAQAGLELIQPLEDSASALSRPGAFGVGVFDDAQLIAAAVAMPARGDAGRSSRLVPGLVHVSSVATHPTRWREGWGAVVTKAILSQAMRRGYARAQLWTYARSPTARRLYERLGFTVSGLLKTDDRGEDVVHYVTDLVAPLHAPRPAARVLGCDPGQRVLLMRWRDPYDGHHLWEPPGGGIEAGETAPAAAIREWTEETGLDVPDLVEPPTDVARDLLWSGHRYVTRELFFLARAGYAGVPDTGGQTPVERDCYLGHAWVPWQDLDDLEDPVEPDLLPILRRLDPDGPWA
jgi:8-oxo-dGTP pyrophosphatase MutT (NUDIX family)/GNAT superfamily N-acetyltransferase